MVCVGWPIIPKQQQGNNSIKNNIIRKEHEKQQNLATILNCLALHVAQVDGFCDDYDVDGQDMHILYINAAIQPSWYEKNQKSQ